MTDHETRVHMIRQHLEAVQDLAESARLDAMKARNQAAEDIIDAQADGYVWKDLQTMEDQRERELAHIERIAEGLRVAGYVI